MVLRKKHFSSVFSLQTHFSLSAFKPLFSWTESASDVIGVIAVIVGFALIVVFAATVPACRLPGAAHGSTSSAYGIGSGTFRVLSAATATRCTRWQAIRQLAPSADRRRIRHRNRSWPDSPGGRSSLFLGAA